MLCAAVLAGAVILAAPALAQQKTAKQCNDEWTANKTALQESGKKKKDFMAECRGTAAGAPSTAPAQGAAKPTTSGQGSTAKPAPTAKAPATGSSAAPGQFTTEAQAKGHCPGDTVVWANLDSRIYHFAGNRSYGHTKKGAYMCERDTAVAGFRAAKNEKHP
jgi:hypothetical protein